MKCCTIDTERFQGDHPPPDKNSLQNGFTVEYARTIRERLPVQELSADIETNRRLGSWMTDQSVDLKDR